MSKLARIVFSLLCSVLLIAGGVTVSAESKQKVYDKADLLSESEEQELEAKLSGIVSEYGHDVIVYTTDSLDGFDAETYTEMLVGRLGAGIDGSGIIYMVSMEYRDYDIFSFGKMGTQIVVSNVRDDIAEDMREYLSDGEYYMAFSGYADRVEREIKHTLENGPNEEPSYAVIIGAVVGLIIGLVTVLIMKSGMKTTRAEAMANNYVRQGSFRLTNARDIFLYSRVTRTKRESSSSSGGGGGGHSSGKF